MLTLTIDTVRTDGGVERRRVCLHAGYGADAALAFEAVQLALLADWPLIMDERGRVMGFRPGSIRQFCVRAP